MLSRVLGGRKAKSAGKSFEELFRILCAKAGASIVRVPDGCRRISFERTIPIKSPFDFVISYKGKYVFCDVKTTCQTNFPQSLIKDHQIEELTKLEGPGRAGYIIHFQKTNEIRWFSVGYIKKAKEHVMSLKPDNGVNIGKAPLVLDLGVL